MATTTIAQPDMQQSKRCAHAHMRAAHGNDQSDRHRQRKNNNRNVRATATKATKTTKACKDCHGETVVDSPLTYACDNRFCCCCDYFFCSHIASDSVTHHYNTIVPMQAVTSARKRNNKLESHSNHTLTRSLTTR